MTNIEARPLAVRLRLCSCAALLSAACSVQAQCPGQTWQTMGDVPGVFGSVHAVVEWDPDGAGPLPSLLVAGGTIHAAGSRLVNNIATWDGAAWSTLGNGLPLTGLRGGIGSLLVHDGRLFAAGSLLAGAGGQPLGSVVSWTGTDWRSLGQDGTATALTEFNGGIAAAVTVGAGISRVVRIVWWDGSVWHTLGTLSGDGTSLNNLILDHGALVAAGEFTSISGVASNGLARWTGAAWVDMGLPAGSRCLSAASNGSDMVVSDVISGSPSVFRTLRRDGTSWIDLPDPLGISFHGRGTLFMIGGDIYATDGGAGGSGHPGVARLAGSQWQPLGTSMLGVRALTSFRDQLIAGGSIGEADGRASFGTAAWDGISWHPLWHGISTSDYYAPRTMVSGGELYACSVRTDPEIGRAIVRWNGHDWDRLLTDDSQRVEVYQGDLILGSDFYTSGLRRYNGSTWETIGPATQASDVPYVLGGRLYAIPDWWAPPGAVFRLDESGWVQLGPTFNRSISSLDMVDGQLYVLAASDADSGFHSVLRWDGTAWIPVGNWPLEVAPVVIKSIVRFNGHLIAAGDFMTPADHNGFAILNGDQWQVWLSPISYATARLVGDELVAIGSVEAHRDETLIAAYDGTTWRTLGTVDAQSYYSNGVTDLQVYRDGVVIAGHFASIDGRCSNMFALLPSLLCCGSADFNHDGESGTDSDISAFFACLAGNCCPACGSADFDDDGDVATDADIEAFFSVLAGGSC